MPLQPINANQAEATVDANGNVALKFDRPPQQTVWTATVAVPGAPPSVRWTASIAGIPVGSFYGSSPAGPWSIPPAAQLVLTASNLTPGAVFTASISGSSVEQDLADPSPAAAPPATNAVSIINEEEFVAGPINDGGAGTTITVNIPPSWSVLHFLNGFGQPAQITVTGVQTGFVYANKLQVIGGASAPSVITPVLIDPAADNQVTVLIKAVGTILQSSVYITAQLNSSAYVVNNPEQPLYIAPGAPSGVGPGGLGFGYNFDVLPYGGLRKVQGANLGAGTSAVLAAPVPGTAFALRRVVFTGTVANQSASLVGHTSGFTITRFDLSTAAGGFWRDMNLDGDLWQEGIDFTTTAGGGVAMLSYDVVTLPVIS